MTQPSPLRGGFTSKREKMAGITLHSLTQFQEFFTGNLDSYGVHIYAKTKKGVKEEGKSFTKTEPVTESLYREHLEGKQGLGIIPIQKDNTCRFAALDIDIYTIEFNDMLSVLSAHNIPLFPFRSKSGGLHLYLFLQSGIQAAKVKEFMDQFRVLLGLAQKTEIFPKQSSLVAGQHGNWINLPYYNAIGKPKQYMYAPDGSPMELEDAMAKIEIQRQTVKSLNEFFSGLPLADGPPCLQHIYLFQDTDFRNEYLFSLARYYKTKHGDDFDRHLELANDALKRPIESKQELHNTIIASHRKKDYSYRCNEEPIVSLCAKALCQKRAYGIGGTEISQLSFEDFIKYETDPPYYEWIINGKSLQFFSEAEIINQHQFRNLCFRELHILPTKIKDLNWVQIVNRALENIIVKEVAQEDSMSAGSLFYEYLLEFLEHRAMAQNRDQILTMDRVFKDEEKESYIFKANNFIKFLQDVKQFRRFQPTEVRARIRRLGGEQVRYYVNKNDKNRRVWKLPYRALNGMRNAGAEASMEIDFTEEYENEEF